jgi:chemotaxis protein methyltransferase CheR
MNELDFGFLQAMLYKRSGLALGREKLYLLESRLGMLCRARRIEGLAALVKQLRTGSDRALETQVVEAMTTNETLFFRDTTPFEQMRRVVIPEVLARNRFNRSLRIWCAGVSSGQEAYSLAMLLKEFQGELAGWCIDLVGTDISTEILDKARSGAYSQFEIQRGLPIAQLLKHFEQRGEQWIIKDDVKRMVRFEPFNLLEPMARFGLFDVIFCRNVMIYFDLPTKLRTLEGLSMQLHPQGALFLGAAETVIGITDRFAPDREHRGLYRLASDTPAAARPAATPVRPGVARRIGFPTR